MKTSYLFYKKIKIRIYNNKQSNSTTNIPSHHTNLFLSCSLKTRKEFYILMINTQIEKHNPLLKIFINTKIWYQNIKHLLSYCT